MVYGAVGYVRVNCDGWVGSWGGVRGKVVGEVNSCVSFGMLFGEFKNIVYVWL